MDRANVLALLAQRIAREYPSVPQPVTTFAGLRAVERVYAGSLRMFTLWLQAPSSTSVLNPPESRLRGESHG